LKTAKDRVELAVLETANTVSDLDVTNSFHEVRALEQLVKIFGCRSDGLLVVEYRERFSEHTFVAEEQRDVEANFGSAQCERVRDVSGGVLAYAECCVAAAERNNPT
jgi:hypothetical protein